MRFTPDSDLRENLRRDISAVNQALSNGEWKAATVLAGSVVEALLLWALQQKSPVDMTTAVGALRTKKALVKNLGTNLEGWHLDDYIAVAEEWTVLSKSTAALARHAKDFRNLIHPGRALRLGQVCDRGTALTTVGVVEHIVRELTP